MLQSFKVTGNIIDILDVNNIVTSTNENLSVLTFILEYTDKKTKHISFNMLGEKRIDRFLKFNDIGKKVTVHFSIDSRLYLDKYINNITAYSVWTHRYKQLSSNKPDFPTQTF